MKMKEMTNRLIELAEELDERVRHISNGIGVVSDISLESGCVKKHELEELRNDIKELKAHIRLTSQGLFQVGKELYQLMKLLKVEVEQ